MKKEKKNLKKSNKFVNILIIIFLLIIGIFLYSRYVGTKGIRVKEYRIVNKEIPKSFSGTKIIQISDIDYGSTTSINDINKMVEKVNEFNPDIIFFTGDLIACNINISDNEINKISNALAKLDNNLGKYAIKGECDMDDDSYFETIMNKSGFQILENQNTLIYNNSETPILLAGTGPSMRSDMNLNKTLSSNKNIKYKIVLTHEGDNADKIIKYDKTIDLILAGHSLNGEIYIPFYGGLNYKKGSYKYYSEYYKVKNTDLYVSSGIGTSSIKHRLFNRPSVNLYRLKSK